MKVFTQKQIGLIKTLIKTKGIKRRDILIKMKVQGLVILNLPEWLKKFYRRKKCSMKF